MGFQTLKQITMTVYGSDPNLPPPPPYEMVVQKGQSQATSKDQDKLRQEYTLIQIFESDFTQISL